MKRSLFGVASVLGLSWLSSAAAAQDRIYSPHGHHYGGGYFFGPVMMILAVAAIVGVVLLAVHLFSDRGRKAQGSGGETPLDILQERFARSEIDKDEYEERRRLLDS